MINLKDGSDVQIWCDYQEEIRQISADYFLRLRFANFRTIVADVSDYSDNYNRNGNGNGTGNGFVGSGYGDGNGNGDGNGAGYGFGLESTS